MANNVGAVVAYSFIANSSTLAMELREAADWPDNNPILDAVTMERLY